MNAISWNCRGFGGPRKKKFLKDTLRATRSKVVFLSETKASARRMARLMRNMPEYSYFAVPSHGRSGGLCMAWDNSLHVQVLNSSLSYICAKISAKDKPPWVLVGVYGDPKHNTNNILWETLIQFISLHGRVCLMGDFNEILSSGEKYGGSTRMKQHTVDFQKFFFDSSLVDIGYKGPAFTWTNKRHVSKAIYQRLDRVLVTPEWLQLYPNAYVNHLPMIHSDHCPILLRIKKPPEKSNNFKIESWWLTEPTFQEEWAKTWSQNTNQPWQQRWDAVKSTMRRWAASHMTPKKKLEKIAQQIQQVQCQHPFVRNHALEEKLLGDYEVAEEQHNTYWRQRSRIQWQEEGDRNTHFFHTVATNRRRHNLITMIKNEVGQLTGDERVVRDQFLSYFKKLYSPNNHSMTQSMEEEHKDRLREEIFNQINQDPKPKFPQSAHRRITQAPSYHEVKHTLFEMGPDKSPGPDGITARFLQKSWHVVGNEVVAQIKRIFQNEEVPEDWLCCRVTLIPKTDEPQTPAEYRPISVGNIFYRLVMKLIANRLRPYLRKVISQEQNAFVKGRSITDSIILVKEALHSFSSATFRQKAFLLKADVNKAFDKLDWLFLQQAMQYLNVPDKIIRIMINSYKKAKITITINGKGDGFIKPSQGLRQGCPMSPYVFIMAMEVLTRLIQGAHEKGLLKGVKMAYTSPTVTHAIYADDLVLMGDTAEAEVDRLISIMHDFGCTSGLCINPQKSRLWFSKQCGNETVQRVQTKWGVERAYNGEKYLGVLVDTKSSAKKNGAMLLEKMKAKLTGWKSRMLSHAGRLVLIKSVLMSMPVYFMSMEMLPHGIIKEINSLLAKFFWGKTGQTRYLSFIAWKHVCKPIELGGLGVKDLQKFGEALFLKVVWSLMADENKSWVKVCKAKYYPIVGCWRARNSNGCSNIWRQVLKMREFFMGQVSWQIGNGDSVNAISQPWFQDWSVQEVASTRDRRLKVCSLVDTQTGQWDMQELARLFQPNQVQQIISGNNRPVIGDIERDKLVWHETKSGKYSVKEGYKILAQEQAGSVPTQGITWPVIFKWKYIAPKVRIFLWRLLRKGLPVATNMHSRLPHVSPMCQRCHEENEYEMHCLFFCHTSRLVWFGCPLGIRVHDLSLDIAIAIEHVISGLNEEGIKVFAYTIWEIWKERNKAVIEHGTFQPQSVLNRVQALSRPELCENALMQNERHNSLGEKYDVYQEGWQVIVDASWETTGRAGGAYILYQKGLFHSMGLHSYTVEDSFHAEAVALKEAVQYVYNRINVPPSATVQFFSDCINLVMAVNHGDTTDLPSWRAAKEVNEIIRNMEICQEGMLVQHAKREALAQVHHLANNARKNSMNFQGGQQTMLPQQTHIHSEMDNCFFQRVQEAPP